MDLHKNIFDGVILQEVTLEKPTLRDFFKDSLNYIQMVIDSHSKSLYPNLKMNFISSKVIFKIKGSGNFEIDLVDLIYRSLYGNEFEEYVDYELEEILEYVCCKYLFYRNESEEKEKIYKKIIGYLNKEILAGYKRIIIKTINELDFNGNIMEFNLFWDYKGLCEKVEDKIKEKKYEELRKIIIYKLKEYYENLMSKRVNAYWLESQVEKDSRLVIELEEIKWN